MVERYRLRERKRGLVGGLLMVGTIVGAVAVWAATASASNGPIVIPFDKSYDGGASALNGVNTYTGPAGDGGRIELRVVGGRLSGPTQHLTAEVTITLGGRWFTARLDGVFNGSAGPKDTAGRTVLNGTVTDGANGWLVGARVHEEGQLVDGNTGRFVGQVQVMPASAG